MSALPKTESGAAALLSRHGAPAPASPWAEAARDAARARLATMGAPGRRDEYWRYTDPSPLTAPSANAAALPPEAEAVFDEVDPLKLVFVDGVFTPDLSSDLALDGVEIQPLAEALATDIHWAKGLFGVLEEAGQTPVARPLAALNTAVAEQGFAIRATGKVERPILFRYLHQKEDSDAVIHHVVKVEGGAALTILENGPAASRFNKSMEVEVADRGVFNHVRAQGRDHDRLAVTHLFTRIGAEASFKSFTLTVNGRLTRNEVVMEFAGDDASGHVAGACIGEGAFHHDDTVFVTHDGVNCESRQVFKKVLKTGAKGVFQGKILVKEGAQKTDGYQISQGLLLDDDCDFSAKPELEIYADDVACSHGSTCGAVDETALFYLRSRGVPEAAAKDMMVIAFVDEAVQEIEDDGLAELIRERIAAWLARRAKA